jgi:hypothetical protein
MQVSLGNGRRLGLVAIRCSRACCSNAAASFSFADCFEPALRWSTSMGRHMTPLRRPIDGRRTVAVKDTSLTAHFLQYGMVVAPDA